MSDRVEQAIERALSPGRFFVAPPLVLRREFSPARPVAWEVFFGHLVDERHTRQLIVADAWDVFVDAEDSPATTPLIAILYERDSGKVFVTRQILVYGFEAYDESPGVIASREVQKWARELVAAIGATEDSRDDLEQELTTAVFQAVIGTSRLPITSLESPLPAFSLGQIGYAPLRGKRDSPWTDPVEFFAATFDEPRSEVITAKALETALRSMAAGGLGRLVDVLTRSVRETGIPSLDAIIRALFNHVALSPYTQFVDRLNELLVQLAAVDVVGAAAAVDLVSYMLRHLCRHLTAFDLATFHNFGANYPDALFLDALLATYLRLIESHPGLLADATDWSGESRPRVRRRALRQACLLRKHYEGHLVPDAPTSMGERLRVLPAPHARVPEEQITQPRSRRRVLFENEPLERLLDATGRDILRLSINDLATAAESAELGTAVFLARPLGTLKQPGEVDRTPLVAYEAFSRSIAIKRLEALQAAGWITSAEHGAFAADALALPISGLAAGELSATARPGVVSLADLAKVAPDFVLLRSTRSSFDALVGHYDLRPLAEIDPDLAAFLKSAEPKSVVAHEQVDAHSASLRIFDSAARLRLELAFGRDVSGKPVYHDRVGFELVERFDVMSVDGRDATEGHLSIALRIQEAVR